MFFKVTFTFSDDKAFSAVVSQQSLPRFLDNLNKGEVYWEQGKGFWLALSQVRYIHIEEVKKQSETQPEFQDPIAY